MTVFTPDGASVFRDFVTDGDPGSGSHNPVKSEIRTWTAAVEDAITDAEVTLGVLEDAILAAVGATGKAVVDFGAFPGSGDTSVSVSGQTGLTTASAVHAWVEATATADHTADEHWADPPLITVGNLGTGSFTVYAVARENISGDTPYGEWTIAWSWTN